MKKVRFAPSPTGSLHVGNALSAVANRGFGDWMLLRIDDTDAGAERRRAARRRSWPTSDWLGIGWDEGPVRQSERAGALSRGGRAARRRASTASRCSARTGRATYHLASVVDDVDFGITHVVRGNDHRPNEALHRRLHEALGTRPPEYVHHGLILGEDGKKLSKRARGSTVADLREAGIPAEAVRAYLEELGLPRARRPLRPRPDPAARRSRRIAAMPDEELAARVGRAGRARPGLRGARDLDEAREYARAVLDPEPASLPLGGGARRSERFRELRERANGGLDAARRRGRSCGS